MSNYEKSLAKIVSVDFEIEDHGIPIWNIRFDYDDGSSQGFGSYIAEISFMCRLLKAIGVYRMSDLKGKSCWVTHSMSDISKVEPLHKNEGQSFVVAEWQEWIKRRGAKLSPYELVTGINPIAACDGRHGVGEAKSAEMV